MYTLRKDFDGKYVAVNTPARYLVGLQYLIKCRDGVWRWVIRKHCRVKSVRLQDGTKTRVPAGPIRWFCFETGRQLPVSMRPISVFMKEGEYENDRSILVTR